MHNLPLDSTQHDETKRQNPLLVLQWVHYWAEERRAELEKNYPECRDNPDSQKLKRCILYYDGDFDHERYDILPAMIELINNCSNKGASYIYALYRPGIFVVSDDVEYSEPEIKEILLYLNQEERVETTRSSGVGGCGINATRNDILDQYNPDQEKRKGNLRYVTDGKRIFAIMVWDETKMEKEFK